MQIGVSGLFEFSEIFGGKLDVTTNCRLELLGGYSLIYAEVRHLDILQALDKAFDLGIGDRSLVVASAGFFTYSSATPGPSTKPLATQFPNTPVPASVAAAARPVDNTTSFWLSVDLAGRNGDAGLFGSLVDIKVSPDATLSLAATFTKGMAAGTAIRTATYTAALDGTITLFDVFSFGNVVVNYSVGAATRLLVAGDIGVSLFGSSFTFSGSVLSDSASQSVTADVQAAGSANLPSLFGGSFPNIEFTGVRFNLYYPYGRNTDAARFMVRGGCRFGGLAFSGLLYMERTTPVLATVVFTQSASIETLFDQCLPNASWPSGLVDLTLKADSQAYYNNSGKPLTLTLSADADGPTLLPVPATPQPASGSTTRTPAPAPPVVVTYQPGFNLSAAFTLSLLDTIDVAGDVVVNGDGVTATIDIDDPIDLYALQIARQGDATKGPALTIRTAGHRGTMGFAAALLFFHEDFANATVALTRGAAQDLLVTTTLSPMKDYPPLLTTSARLGFSYSRAQGFQVTDWPAIAAVRDIVDFFDELKKLANSGGCGQITDFVCQNLLQQSWSISPSFSSTGGALTLSLTIACTLRFMGSHQADIATITLPNALVIPVPSSISLDPDSPTYLWTVIVDAIGDAAQSFVKALLDNGDATASFLVLFGGQAALNYAATLICEGLVDAAVDGAVSAGVAAAGEALGTAAAAAGAIAAAVAGSNGGHGGGSGGGGGGGGGGTPPPDAPASVAAQIDGGAITASWSPTARAQGYTVTLACAGQSIAVGNTAYGVYSYAFGTVAPPSPLPATATLSVTANNPAGTSAATSTTITFLAPPANLAAQPATTAPDVAVRLDWTGGVADTGYVVSLSGMASRGVPVAVTTAALVFGPADPAGAYDVTVTATGGSGAVASAASAALALTRLAAPASLSSRSAAAPGEAAVALDWSPVGEATGYVVVVTGGRNTVFDSVSSTTTLTFAAADPAGDYAITVTATGGAATIPSIASPPLVLTRLAAPAGLTARATGAAIEASWIAVTDAAAYALNWTAPDGRQGTQAIPASSGPTISTSLALVPPVDGVWTIIAQARPAEAAGRVVAGPPSAPLRVTVAAPTTPQELAANCFAAGIDGAACGTALIGSFTTLSEDALAWAMAQAGYAAEATASGLQAAFPTITPAHMVAALVYAYPPAPTTPAQLARTCFSHQVAGSDCGRQLIAAFADLAPDPLAWAMAQGGYTAEATADGLQAAFPTIAPARLAAALAYAYPATADQLARACFVMGASGANCGRRLVASFADLVADPLAAAMARGGYAAEAAAAGLTAAYPSIPAAQMAVALARAYP